MSFVLPRIDRGRNRRRGDGMRMSYLDKYAHPTVLRHGGVSSRMVLGTAGISSGGTVRVVRGGGIAEQRAKEEGERILAAKRETEASKITERERRLADLLEKREAELAMKEQTARPPMEPPERPCAVGEQNEGGAEEAPKAAEFTLGEQKPEEPKRELPKRGRRKKKRAAETESLL